ncbi:MAG TPA: prolyl oligopeptidase family serine peptidase [Candidatus Limnocylindria bacterium]|nr:prolyl oligopeptidase family serine peptidase [Candidatus Limnocylindria bacterium]
MSEAAWRRRFRAPRTSLPRWAEDRPHRLLYRSNAGGKWELYAWDAERDDHRQVTDRREGTLLGQIDPDGERIVWFDDTDGDEFGRWQVAPFAGGDTVTLHDDLSPAYSSGLALGRRVAVVGSSTDGDNRVDAVARKGGAPRTLYRHTQLAWLGNISRDESLLAIHHSEHGDSRHPAVRALDVASGASVAELWDGGKASLSIGRWSPAEGDNRVVLHHERNGRKEPMLWSPESRAERMLRLELPGETHATWYPDASSLLLRHDHAGRTSLFCYDLATDAVRAIPTGDGRVADAAVRPDGAVWLEWSNAGAPWQVRAADGASILAPAGEPAPGGVPYRDLHVGKIHSFVASPPGAGPHPTVFLVHGGPDSHVSDEFAPPVQAWVDHGFAVVLVNYRGSTGYGQEWRDAITGNPGFTELEDLVAVRERAVADGLADPGRLVLAGGSWGGYLTLLGLGMHPELWSLGLAVVPVADYLAAYEDEMEPLKAFDRSLFGGVSPADDPERYRLRSPLTYAENLRAPVLVLAGENDPRCPIRQIDNYLRRLEELGKPHEVRRFDAGHGSQRTEERIRHLEWQIDFVARHLGTRPPMR